jgi:hypothetical protein
MFRRHLIVALPVIGALFVCLFIATWLDERQQQEKEDIITGQRRDKPLDLESAELFDRLPKDPALADQLAAQACLATLIETKNAKGLVKFLADAQRRETERQDELRRQQIAHKVAAARELENAGNVEQAATAGPQADLAVHAVVLDRSQGAGGRFG